MGKGDGLMKSFLSTVFAILVLAAPALAAGPGAAPELPSAPSSVIRENNAAIVIATPVVSQKRTAPFTTEGKTVDTKVVALSIISTGSAFADSYTTLFARQNWLAGKKGVCNAEVESAYLYGAHPTVARTYAVASIKSVSAVAAAYYLRKHHHSKLWSLPLISNTVSSLQGTTQNMIACN
jgi:hypothetical protein